MFTFLPPPALAARGRPHAARWAPHCADNAAAAAVATTSTRPRIWSEAAATPLPPPPRPASACLAR